MHTPDSRTETAAATAFPASGILRPLERFFQVEAASGIVLLAATALALLWANSPWSAAYEVISHLPAKFAVAGHEWEVTLHFAVNEGLMTVFFLLVGLEIRRELHDGALSAIRQAVVPVAAALGGVIVPAIVYLALVAGEDAQRGWAVPTATDIAFAIGVLTVLGSRVPSPVRVLLLALAIIDDIVAILVIAFFYSSGINLAGLLVAVSGIVVVIAFQRLGVRTAPAYVLPAVVVWAGLLRAGVHPTLAGVILGLLTPAVRPSSRERLLTSASRALDELRERLGHTSHRPQELAQPVKRLRRAQLELLPPVERVQSALHPWVAYGIMPLFAFANAGVRIDGLMPGEGGAELLTAAIVFALVLGKPVGIVGATRLVTRSGLGVLSPGLDSRGVVLVGCLGGIGFTMSIFIADLAFDGTPHLEAAKLAVLFGSALAASAGLLIGRFFLFRHRRQTDSEAAPPDVS